MFLSFLPVTLKITVWICIAHFWIIVCTMVYVELEGFSTDNHQLPLHETDLLIKTISDLKTDFSELKNNPLQKHAFQKVYKERLDDNRKWAVRRHFNDVSKSYVFVLLSHTAIGSHGDLRLQTWQAQLFYILSMPLGLAFYYVMIHVISTEIFEVYAYAAVTVCQRTQLAWSVDQRELYEKFKVFILAGVVFVISPYLLGLLSLLSGQSYLTGIYWLTNLMFQVTSSEQMFPYTDIQHKVVAALMTFLVFAVILISYTFLYSMFIMFRYNGVEEIRDMLFADADGMNDITTNDGEFDDFQTTAEDDFWWEKEGNLEHIRDLPMQAKLNLTGVQPRGKHTYAPKYTTSTESSDISSDAGDEGVDFKENLRRSAVVTKPPLNINTSKIQPKYKSSPSIEITNPTPSPDTSRRGDYLEDYARSEFTNISLRDGQINN